MAVTSGLALGDQVVVDGADKLKEGMPVVVPGPSGAKHRGGRSGRKPAGVGAAMAAAAVVVAAAAAASARPLRTNPGLDLPLRPRHGR